jgi:hypothetical protein
MPLSDATRESAARVRAAIVGGAATAESFRAALEAVARAERDGWLDLVLGIEGVPDDGPELPPGCVPYLPATVDVLGRMIVAADVRGDDVFVDVGSGLGRAAALTHLLTGAAAVGVEVQPHLARASRELAARLRLPALSVVEGDAAHRPDALEAGTVFFFNCPFSGERLARVLDALEPVARARRIRVCAVDVPLPARPWLTPLPLPAGELAVYRSR